jgi:hypothetical protein
MGGKMSPARRAWIAGWFDGLFQETAEVATPERVEPATDYAAGFRQGVLDARAVAALRRSMSGRLRIPRLNSNDREP